MKYTKKQYIDFLSTELEIKENEYEQLVNIRACTLKERGDVFVGIFQKTNEQGFAIFKVRTSDKMPRKNSFWTSVLFVDPMFRFKEWGDLSWLELRTKYQIDFSAAHCCWIGKCEDEDFCLVGFKNITIDFLEKLTQKSIVAFGPEDPPRQYLKNLINFVEKSSSDIFLYYDAKDVKWLPLAIGAEVDTKSFLINELESSSNIIIQGPPGTGKTFRMSEMAAHLLSLNKSVLVTAFTNQALMELATKESLKEFIKSGKVSKTSLTIDELKSLPNLKTVEGNKCNPIKGRLTLASFYVSSGWVSDEPSFDYVIMDEASQALYPMIALSYKLGGKILWVGDQKQLAPIISTNEDIVNGNGWNEMVSGFSTLCNNFNFKSFLLKDTFRLTQRGADCTGVFYKNQLQSKSEYKSIPIDLKWLNLDGGPIIDYLPLPIGEKCPNVAKIHIFKKVREILSISPKASIAILCKFTVSVRELQKAFVLNLSVKELPENIKIETVDRVQGLTIDYCFYLIPNSSTRYSLHRELFNVATSRARYCTIIVADNLLLKENMNEEVRRYLLKASESAFVSLEKKKSLNVKGKIDLSQFQRIRTEIVDGKENVYIVDTNVFVECPDIITKIGSKYQVIIPSIVLEELDKLKLRDSIDKLALNKAAKNISMAFVQHFSHMEDGDVSLLPEGFDKRNPDCKILSVALKNANENTNPILLTSDVMLSTRAKGLGIKSLTLKEFLRK